MSWTLSLIFCTPSLIFLSGTQPYLGQHNISDLHCVLSIDGTGHVAVHGLGSALSCSTHITCIKA